MYLVSIKKSLRVVLNKDLFNPNKTGYSKLLVVCGKPKLDMDEIQFEEYGSNSRPFYGKVSGLLYVINYVGFYCDCTQLICIYSS